MSTFGPYCLRETTSGAIQYLRIYLQLSVSTGRFKNRPSITHGVPTIVSRLDFSDEICAQKPKSVSLTDPSRPRRILSDFMSRCITWFECKNSSAWSTSRHTDAICASLMTVSVTTSRGNKLFGIAFFDQAVVSGNIYP
jgi:hypothetical protein